MARYKYIDTNPRFLPIDLARQLLPGTFEHALNHLLDPAIDLSAFDARFRNDETGAPAYPPAMLRKVVLAAYGHGIVSRIGGGVEHGRRPDLSTYTPEECETLDKQDLDLGSSAFALPSSSTGRRCGDRGGRNRQGSRNLDATRGSRPSERDARRGADLVLPQSLRVWRRARRRGWRTTGLALPSCRWQRLRRAGSVGPRCGTHGGRRGHRCIVFSRTATSR